MKPENVVYKACGQNGLRGIYVVDFGISKFLDFPYEREMNRSFVGTSRFASKAAHLGLTLTKRDDLESLGYMLVFLFSGIEFINKF